MTRSKMQLGGNQRWHTSEERGGKEKQFANDGWFFLAINHSLQQGSETAFLSLNRVFLQEIIKKGQLVAQGIF